jgi:plasmid stability protein
MTDVKVRRLDDWVVESFRARAKKAGRSLEEELRQTLTEVARMRREALIGEINTFREELRAKYGEMADSTPLIREMRADDIG